jgi:signal transduction histidine kinase/ActR/RegA family two-component response regulator
MQSIADATEERMLVLAPHGRDASVIAEVLARDGLHCVSIAGFGDLRSAVSAGAAAAILSEEAFINADLGPLQTLLEAQEPWSDFPFVLLLSKQLDKRNAALADMLGTLGNVIVLERPLSADMLRSASLSALRARRRQYQARTVLQERQNVTAELAALNATLEDRVQLRTHALAQANNRLTAEIIEKEKAQLAMMQYQKMESLGRLTGGVAHDFNNILSVIQNSMELLLLTSNDEQVRKRAETVRAACGRGAKLTSQLLSFARKQTLDIKALQLRPVFDNAAALAKPLLGAGIELRMNIAPDVECVLADASQLEMALLNLMINSRDALADQGRITMHAELLRPPPDLPAGHEYIRISVSDNGSGMSQEISAKVFEPFFTTKGVGRGTGLGLSQVYGMAEQSGGLARLDSQRGIGTTVEIWLRAARDKECAQQPDEAAPPHSVAARVLVVEDDPTVRATLVDALTTLGFDVAQAASGGEGLQALAAEKPDVLLTDYLMPGMTGAELAQAAAAQFPGLPVIVVTGYADMEAVQHAIGNGTVLRKPFKLAELHHAIGKALRPAARSASR